jgi:predicted permease
MIVYDYKRSISLSIAKVPLIGLAVMFVVMAAAWAIGKAIKLDRRTLPGFILAAGFGNTGFLGYPVVSAAFRSQDAMLAAALYDELAMALPLYVFGMLLVASFAGEKTNHSHVIKALKMPQLWAIPIGLVLRQVHLPVPLVTAIDYLAKGTIPLVMISLGLTLNAKSLKGYAIPIATVCLLKLAVLPVITYYATRSGGLTGTIHQSTVLESGMPTAMMAGVLVAKFGENAEFMAGVIFITTLLSILTIPATLLILGVPAH